MNQAPQLHAPFICCVTCSNVHNMTKLAIIAAMPGELKPLVRGWQHQRSNGIDLWRHKFDQHEWIAACAGAGVDAAMRAFTEAEKYGALDAVISTGWAGALREELATGHAFDVSCVIDARTGERYRYRLSSQRLLAGHQLPRRRRTRKEASRCNLPGQPRRYGSGRGCPSGPNARHSLLLRQGNQRRL